jgi:DNA-binding FadR family transcriptional regulator
MDDIRQRSRRPGTLVLRVSDALRQSIMAGEFAPGDKLPSEAQLTETHGVSRTVVREAVAALRSEGLVAARQGAGVFVLGDHLPQQDARSADRSNLFTVLELLEVRTPLEVEAAGLAALRRSPAQEEAIFERHAAVIDRTERGLPIREADFALHLAIAGATNNPRFSEFLESHGMAVIPNSKIVTGSLTDAERAYHRQLNQEHEAIVMAISRGDEEGARDAMRAHLKGSQLRHRDLLYQSPTIRLDVDPAAER